MSECCPPSQPSCCGGSREPDYRYGPQPFESGAVDTLLGPVPRVETTLTPADRLGALKMRLDIGRSDYRVRPGLYAVGEPDDTSPVLLSANYKLSFDALRSSLHGRSLWILVVDTRGINVWCAAGKGTFSTQEVVARVREAQLPQIVSHRKLVLPQLAATGVAAHEVRAATGYSVVWGPVRAEDIPAFLDAGMKAEPEMRRVRFPVRERAKLVGVELALLRKPMTLLALAAVLLAGWLLQIWLPGASKFAVAAAAVGVAAIVAGTTLAPLALPWLPGRTFSAKGALAGLLAGAAALLLVFGTAVPAPIWGLAIAAAGLASFIAMNFTGSSTFTSPSGVEWEMRHAMPLQLAALVLGVCGALVGAALGGM